jgi:hypothetical protein
VDGCVLRSPESLAAGGEMGYEARPEGEAKSSVLPTW